MMQHAARVRNGNLETAICDLWNPATSSHIWLVGISHLGTPGYYEGLANFIDSKENQGALVHHEGIIPSSDKEWAKLEPSLCRAYQRYEDSSAALLALLTHTFRATLQKDALQPADHWENHDLEAARLAAMLGRAALNRIAWANKALLLAHGLSPALTEKGMRGRAQSGQRAFQPTTQIGRSLAVISDERSDVASLAAMRQVVAQPRRSLVVAWGPDHLPDIMEGLQGTSYEQYRELEWRSAFSVANPASNVE